MKPFEILRPAIRCIAVIAVASFGAVLPMSIIPTNLSAEELPANDYPTVARADYVYACMAVNGQTRDFLEKCSCSIDQIAAILPWSEYEEAETLMSLGLKGGENVAWTKAPQFAEKVKNLRRA